MKQYVGIDLGTTNSAICSFDGQNTRVWKSPEQNDVTPSAIYIDKRGNRFYGQKAYNLAPYEPENSGFLFKRSMGTNEKLNFKSASIELTPEECSAEILKILFGYLPEEIRNDPETATVITVPAAFNQMKKSATLQAAKIANIGQTALMQEPVAAIMSIMKASKKEGIFLVYDLGGGTFDVSIAENIGGNVNLLAHGGIEMCGGREIDRAITNKIIIPWLKNKFVLPDDIINDNKYKSLYRISQFAAEKAKIELSSNQESVISLAEVEIRSCDIEGNKIYLDIPINRAEVDMLLTELITDTIEKTRETMSKAGLSAGDVNRIIYIGGPTVYKPLRDKVSFELGLPASIDINPMTAVAEGASIFAESIDWSSTKHNRKALIASVRTDLNIDLRYPARTTQSRAKIVFITDETNGYAVEITSIDTGWTSGRSELINGMFMELPLDIEGDNRFKFIVYGSDGQKAGGDPIKTITITKTPATINAIPASHSIGVEVLEKLGGSPVLEFLVFEGDELPKKGHTSFKAAQTIKAGSHESINIKLWEGSITDPITDNQPIGCMKITGTDFEEGLISIGDEIECEFEMADSGAIYLEVSIPSISANFEGKNFYSRQEGQKDFIVDEIIDDAKKLSGRINGISGKIDDPRIERASKKVQRALLLESEICDTEDIQEAQNYIKETKKLVAQACEEHKKEIRQMDLNSCINFFNSSVKKYTKPSEIEEYENLVKAAERSIERGESGFENQLLTLRRRNWTILWRQDWYVIDFFNNMVKNPYDFSDLALFEELKQRGFEFIKRDQIDELRSVSYELFDIKIRENTGEEMFDVANIVRG